jgi:hypothetical protein
MKKTCFHRALHKLLALVSLMTASAMTVCAQTPLKREIIVGGDFDSFNFAGPAQALSLAYRADINPEFALELDGYGYSRFGSGAGRGGLSLTYSPTRRTSVTVGGSAGPSNPVAARGESFAEIDHGIDVSEKGLIRGVELDDRRFCASDGSAFCASDRRRVLRKRCREPYIRGSSWAVFCADLWGRRALSNRPP